MSRPKMAVTWLSGCGGCDESLLDMAVNPGRVLEGVDVVFWPLLMDGKLEDLRALADGEIALSLINGAVRTDENVETTRLLRRKSRVLAAFGACAHLGGVYGLANLSSAKEVFERSYGKGAGSASLLEGKGRVPRLLDRVLPLDRVVEVDAVIPGCPPVSAQVRNVLHGLLKGAPPEGRRVLAEERALCDTCPRRETRTAGLRLPRFRRAHETAWDEDRCFLDQGIVCLGPATRGGCEARCIQGNMPCRGCFGPVEGVTDQGAGAVGFLAALMDGSSQEDMERAAKGLPDPAGLLYRYSLPASLMGGAISKGKRREP